jgi:hypothetical protein
MSVAEIHHELRMEVYNQNLMSNLMFIMRSEVFCQPSIMSGDLVPSVDQKIYERWCFTISGLLLEFPQILCTLLCEIITG